MFLSFEAQDQQLARELKQDLLVEGIHSWSRQSLGPKATDPSAKEQVRSLIEEAQCVLLLLSDASLNSDEVGWELERARDAGTEIIVAQLDGSELPQDLDPYACVDFRDDWAFAVDDIVERVTNRPTSLLHNNMLSTRPYVLSTEEVGSDEVSAEELSPSPSGLESTEVAETDDAAGASHSHKGDALVAAYPTPVSVKRLDLIKLKANSKPVKPGLSRKTKYSIITASAIAAGSILVFGTHIISERNDSPAQAVAALRAEQELYGTELLRRYLTQTDERREELLSPDAWQSAHEDFAQALQVQSVPKSRHAHLLAQATFCEARVERLRASALLPNQAQAKLGEVVDKLERSAQLSPKWAIPQIELTLVQLQLGQTAKAEERAEAALSLAPSSWLAISANASVLLAQAKPARAIRELQRALSLAPEAPSLLGEVALAHVAVGEVSQAESLAKQALNSDPNQLQAHLALASIANGASRWQAAADHAGLAIKNAPLNPRSWLLLGNAYAALGTNAAAEAAYRRGLELIDVFKAQNLSAEALQARTWLTEHSAPLVESPLASAASNSDRPAARKPAAVITQSNHSASVRDPHADLTKPSSGEKRQSGAQKGQSPPKKLAPKGSVSPGAASKNSAPSERTEVTSSTPDRGLY